jgi:dihydropteroate synthase
MPIAAYPTATATDSLLCPGGRRITLEPRPLIMGVLNVTPDSFSDGGLWLEPKQAIEHATAMVAQGAELLDLGAESTRPGGGIYGHGAQIVPAAEELRRLIPVLEAVRKQVSIPISVDTRKGEVARAALAAGADLINDISAGTDPKLLAAVASSGCPVVLMHSRGPLHSMQRQVRFDDLLGEVRAELDFAVERAVDAGIDRQQIIIDPGLGFGKKAHHNLELLRRLDSLGSLGRPILVGASRKSFIGDITDTPPDQRLAGSLATIGWAARQGVAIVRVHDVAETVQYLRIWQAIDEAAGDGF